MSQDRNPRETEFVDFIREGNLAEVRRILSKNGNSEMSNPLLKEKFGQFKETALHLAVKYDHEGIVNLLLEMGADIHATDRHKCTVLHTAADQNEGIDIIALILKCNGVNVNALDGFGNTPVKLAAEKGNSDAVRLLMENTADITIADKGENTALHVAAKKGHVKVLEMLLKKLANTGIIGKQNKDRNTPLHLAVEKESQKCVAMLLNSGAASTMDVKNENGQTAAELAKDHGDKEIIKFLENPQKAKELFQEKPKPVKTASRSPQLGRGFSVEADSPANNPSYQMTLSGPQEVMQQFPQNAVQVQVITNQLTINQQFSTTVNGGEVAIGPGSKVVKGQDPTAMAPPQPLLHVVGESHYEANVTGGNASIGDYSTINVGKGTARTPSTAGSSDVPFFPEPQENGDTSSGSATLAFPSGESSGFPTENVGSFEATEALPHPVPEESPGDKANAPLNHPVQEENPKDKSITPLPHPVQEENPKGKSNEPLPHPILEENPADKSNASLSSPIQEEFPKGKENTSLCRPIQEESPTEKANVSLSSPIQEQSPAAKATTSLPYSVPEEKPAQKPDGPVTSSPARDHRLTGGTVPSRSSTGERATESIGPGAMENAATRTVVSPRNDNAEEAIAPSDAVGAAGDSRTVTNTNNQTGAIRAKSSGGTSFKPDVALGQSWQGTIGSGNQRRANPVTRSAPKEAQDRLLQEVGNSPSSELPGLDELCAQSQKWSGKAESQSGKRHGQWADVVTKGKNAVSSGVVLHRAHLAKSSGPSMLLTIPDQQKSDVEPSTCASVSQNTASSNVGACNNSSLGGTAGGSNSSSPCAHSSSSSKESPHRKERPSREDAISDGPLPAGTVADGNEATRAARNGEALSAGNHARDERSSDSRNNLSGDTQSSADGDSTVIMLEDANPEDDPKKSCPSNCRPM